jgi:hypothetical protein
MAHIVLGLASRSWEAPNMLMLPSISIMTFAAVVVAVGLVIAWFLGGIVPAESPSNVKPLTATTGHNDDDGFRKVA